MSSVAPDFDPRIIEQFAEKLYGKASSFLLGSVVCGVLLGMAFGAVPLTSLGAAWPIPSMLGFFTMLLGGILGGVIGYVVGDTRAFGYKLQAQAALCQLEVERNTAEMAYFLHSMAEGASAAAAAPQQRVAPAPPVAAPPLAAPPVAAPPVAAPPVAPRRDDPPLSPPVSGAPPVAAAR